MEKNEPASMGPFSKSGFGVGSIQGQKEPLIIPRPILCHTSHESTRADLSNEVQYIKIGQSSASQNDKQRFFGRKLKTRLEMAFLKIY